MHLRMQNNHVVSNLLNVIIHLPMKKIHPKYQKIMYQHLLWFVLKKINETVKTNIYIERLKKKNGSDRKKIFTMCTFICSQFGLGDFIIARITIAVRYRCTTNNLLFSSTPPTESAPFSFSASTSTFFIRCIFFCSTAFKFRFWIIICYTIKLFKCVNCIYLQCAKHRKLDLEHRLFAFRKGRLLSFFEVS